MNHLNAMKSNLKTACCLILFICLNAGNIHGGQWENRRVRLGLELFPSFLAADRDIADKTGPDGKLALLLVYDNNPDLAEKLARRLNRIRSIRGAPIHVTSMQHEEFSHFEDAAAAGIFLVQRMGPDLDQFIEYGKEHGVIVFSPFEEDVERGVSGGVIITHRIFPYINKKTVLSSGIRFKKFFLRVADIYEK